MLRDLDRIFEFSALTEAEVRYAFTYWLQNVLNMPLSLIDENVRMFCAQHDLEPEQLFAAADELDVNLALVDDVVQLHLTRQALSRERQEEKAEIEKRGGTHVGP
jgi:hypothetical protein